MFILSILLSKEAESIWYDAVVNNPVVSPPDAVIFNLATWADWDNEVSSASVAKELVSIDTLLILLSNDALSVE